MDLTRVKKTEGEGVEGWRCRGVEGVGDVEKEHRHPPPNPQYHASRAVVPCPGGQ
jgi:hypothetical protein